VKIKVIVMGAAGRDFHNFNTFFRNNPNYKVVCFTATQIPNISGRKYPPELAGKLYPKGIPIYPEDNLPGLIKKHSIDQVVLAYSDLPHQTVMEKASIVNSAGADFRLLGPNHTMIPSKKPIVAITAVRTGCGKSQTTRHVAIILRGYGKRVVVVRHPMPYGDLKKQEVQRFAVPKDLDTHNCTIEEREEYEPLIDMGVVVYAGVDYEKILRRAEKEADVVIWDGGNNDFPFYRPDLWITITDPHRPDHETTYYPGYMNLLSADVVIINKEKTADKKNIQRVMKNIRHHNPGAKIIHANSMITTDNPGLIANKKVLVVEDGPTLTHGGMKYGAGTIAAQRHGSKITDPRPYLPKGMKKIFTKYPHLGKILPAMGYSASQIMELQKIINKIPCDTIISGTPIDLRRVIQTKKPIVRIQYELKEISKPNLHSMLKKITRPRK